MKIRQRIKKRTVQPCARGWWGVGAKPRPEHETESRSERSSDKKHRRRSKRVNSKTVRWTVFEEGKPCKRGFPCEKHGRSFPQAACGLTGSVRQGKSSSMLLTKKSRKGFSRRQMRGSVLSECEIIAFVRMKGVG